MRQPEVRAYVEEREGGGAVIERRTPDGWTVYLDHDGKREILRVKYPENVTREELERFVEHLKKLARENQHGPS